MGFFVICCCFEIYFSASHFQQPSILEAILRNSVYMKLDRWPITYCLLKTLLVIQLQSIFKAEKNSCSFQHKIFSFQKRVHANQRQRNVQFILWIQARKSKMPNLPEVKYMTPKMASGTTRQINRNIQPSTPKKTKKSLAIEETNFRRSFVLMRKMAQPSIDLSTNDLNITQVHTSPPKYVVKTPILEKTFWQPTSRLDQTLAAKGLRKYIPLFEKERINSAIFISLNEEDLTKLGIKSALDRGKILEAIKELKM